VRTLEHPGQFRGGGLALLDQFREHLQFGEAQWHPLLVLLLDHPSCHGQVGWAARKDGDNMGVGASPVIGCRSAHSELLGEHSVDPAPGSLYEADALKCIRKERAARMRWRDEQVGHPYAAG